MERVLAVDDLLSADERVIWRDSPSGPGTRIYRDRIGALIFDKWLPLIFMALAGVGMIGLAFTLDMFPRIMLLLVSGALLTFTVLTVHAMRKDSKYFRHAEIHYVLTNARLIAHNVTDKWTAQVFPGGLAGIARANQNLELYLKEPDEPLTLYLLGDIDAAEHAISQTLGPIP